jgi:hypothetical protein
LHRHPCAKGFPDLPRFRGRCVAVTLAPCLASAAQAGEIYWIAQDESGSRAIGTARLDGTGVDASLIAPVLGGSVAVDDSYVYWTNGDVYVGRANLDGTGVDPTSSLPPRRTPSPVSRSTRATSIGRPAPLRRGQGARVAVASQPATACDNGVDDDGDGLLDHPVDPGCSSPFDESELSVVQCDDGRDDDGDGAIDWRGDDTGDPDCRGIGDRSELPSLPPGCGLGPELALLLPALVAAAAVAPQLRLGVSRRTRSPMEPLRP